MAESKVWRGTLPFVAAARLASAMSSSTPVFRNAEIITTAGSKAFGERCGIDLVTAFFHEVGHVEGRHDGKAGLHNLKRQYRLRSRFVASMT